MAKRLQEKRVGSSVQLIEHGTIYFFYIPLKKERLNNAPHHIARFYFILASGTNMMPRNIVMANKKMPGFGDRYADKLGTVLTVGGNIFLTYPRLSANRVNTRSIAAGEGVYAICTHREHTHLLYSLEFPAKPGPVEALFDIADHANYIILERSANDIAHSIKKPYENFTPVTAEVLNQRGTEVILEDPSADLRKYSVQTDLKSESVNPVILMSGIHASQNSQTARSLISGYWDPVE